LVHALTLPARPLVEEIRLKIIRACEAISILSGRLVYCPINNYL